MPFTFAYGSNMDWDQIRDRCPSAQFKCIASLKDYRLAFTRKSTTRNCGVADVVPAPGTTVWGVIYEITDDDMYLLDRREGVLKNNYVRRSCIVHQNGDEKQPISVEIYFAVPQQNPPLPYQEYKNLLLNGARHWNLPDDYVVELEKIEVA